MDASQETENNDTNFKSTLDFDNDPTLESEDEEQAPPQPTARVMLTSRNVNFPSIQLETKKTLLGRNKAKCTPNAFVDHPAMSGVHCSFTSRSWTDKNAPIWITDTSTNGVWINGAKIPKGEAKKIINGDTLAFCRTNIPTANELPSYILTDSRVAAETEAAPRSTPKRTVSSLDLSDDDAEETGAQVLDPKRQKTESGSTSSNANHADAKQIAKEEENAFEKEFECGICHDIMQDATSAQPCLHSFCRACCKTWFTNSRECPGCRAVVTQTKRDFKINNLIALFLKSRPHLSEGRDEAPKDDGPENLIPIRNNMNLQAYSDDEDEGEDEDDEESDDDNNSPIEPCPCCDPANTLGYVCSPANRLPPRPNLRHGSLYGPQAGHISCRACWSRLPFITEPGFERVKALFKCKLCSIPTCGCTCKSLNQRIALNDPVPAIPGSGFLNPAEVRYLNEYLAANNIQHSTMWQEIKDGILNGTFFYLRHGNQPRDGPVAAVAAPVRAQAPAEGNDNDDVADDNQPPVPAPAAPANPVAPPQRAVDPDDLLCQSCAFDYFSHGPLYQWRKAIPAANLPAHVAARSSCWYGRECRTQHNPMNPQHAERMNHICEQTRFH